MNAIELKGVNKKLGSFAIQDLSLTVPMGTICGLVGENGANVANLISQNAGETITDPHP